MIPTLGSLFAGSGGIDLGFQWAGFKVAWQVENNPFCRKVLAKHFPDAERFEDVQTVGSHNLKPVDVIAGGFPCQDISNAGKRAGITGERSGLWSEYARIIGELRPRFVLVENVAALLGRGMGRVCGDLAEIGYDAEWEIISAADVGAPHLRERVWIVAYSECMRKLQPQGGKRNERRWTSDGGVEVAHANHAGLEGRISPILLECAGKLTARTSSACEMAHSARELLDWRGIARRRGAESANGGCWLTEPNVGRVAHGVPARVDRLKALGNAVVPQIPELIARRILEAMK